MPSFFISFLPSLTELYIDDSEPVRATDIISMVNYSSCLLEKFAQSQSDSTPYHLEALNDLLDAIPSVTEFKASRIIFPASTLEKIGCGKLLPRLVDLTCSLSSLDPFVNMVENLLQTQLFKTAAQSEGLVSRKPAEIG